MYFRALLYYTLGQTQDGDKNHITNIAIFFIVNKIWCTENLQSLKALNFRKCELNHAPTVANTLNL